MVHDRNDRGMFPGSELRAIIHPGEGRRENAPVCLGEAITFIVRILTAVDHQEIESRGCVDEVAEAVLIPREGFCITEVGIHSGKILWCNMLCHDLLVYLERPCPGIIQVVIAWNHIDIGPRFLHAL
ncbi:hypothetical protein D3C74_389920 [compost metagenome]